MAKKPATYIEQTRTTVITKNKPNVSIASHDKIMTVARNYLRGQILDWQKRRFVCGLGKGLQDRSVNRGWEYLRVLISGRDPRFLSALW